MTHWRNPPEGRARDPKATPRGEGPEVFYPVDDKEFAATIFALLVFVVAPIGVVIGLLLWGFLSWIGLIA